MAVRACDAARTALSRPADRSTAIRGGWALSIGRWEFSPLRLPSMYSVTKRIDFCYGHRLLDYDGVCKHPHGHNAIAEIEVRNDALDSRNMVADFSDIKRIVKGWIDRELDHKMILREDDPLVAPLRALGEPMYLLESNPTIERIARLIFEKGREQGIDIMNVRVWETPTSFATYDGQGA